MSELGERKNNRQPIVWSFGATVEENRIHNTAKK
jgi:hypothetical protein